MKLKQAFDLYVIWKKLNTCEESKEKKNISQYRPSQRKLVYQQGLIGPLKKAQIIMLKNNTFKIIN